MIRSIVSLLCVAVIFARWPAAAQYPRVELTPAMPTTGDSVTLALMLGAVSGCPPVYTDSVVISESPGVFPPERTLVLHYEATPPGRDVECPDTLTEHGPVYHLGYLPYGHYSVYRSGEQAVLLRFEVSSDKPGFTVWGTVRDTAHGGTLPTADVLIAIEQCDSLGVCKTIDSMPTRNMYGFVGVAAGEYTLTAVSPGNYQPVAEGLVVSRDTNVVVSLVPEVVRRPVWGEVSIWSYDTIETAGCTVTVVPECGGDTVGSPRYTAVTDSAGKYTTDTIPITYDCTWAVAIVKTPLGIRDTIRFRLLPDTSTATSIVRPPTWAFWENDAVVRRGDMVHHFAASCSRCMRDRVLIVAYGVQSLRDTAFQIMLPSNCEQFGDMYYEVPVHVVGLSAEGDTVALEAFGRPRRWRPCNPESDTAPVVYSATVERGLTLCECSFSLRELSLDSIELRAWLHGSDPSTALSVWIVLEDPSSNSVTHAPVVAVSPFGAFLSGNSVRLRLRSPSRVVVQWLGLDGRLLHEWESPGRLVAGTHSVDWPGRRGMRAAVVRVIVGRHERLLRGVWFGRGGGWSLH